MTGLPGAIPSQTSGSGAGAPGAVPLVISGTGKPGTRPADTSSPGDPVGIPIQTSSAGMPGLLPIEVPPTPYNPFTGSIALSAATVAENSGANTSIGALSVAAPGAIITWSLSDDANGTFYISGAKNNELWLNWVQLDFSVTTSYSITAQAVASNGAGRTSAPVTKQFTITVTASTNPGATSNLPVIAADFRHGVTQAGGSVSAVAAAWSASGVGLTGLAGNLPTIANQGPKLQPYVNLATNQCFTFGTAGTSVPIAALTLMTAFDLYAVVAAGATTAFPFLAKNSNTLSFITLRHSSLGAWDQVQFRSDTGVGNTTVTFSGSQFMPIGYLTLVRIKFDGTNLVVYLNGTQVATSAAAATQTFSFSQFGRINAVASTGINVYVGAFALYSAVQSAGDVTALSAWFEPWRGQRRFTANAGSDASLTPWLIGSPVKTAAVAANSNFLRPGDSPLFNRGDKWINDQIVAAAPGVAGLPIVVDAFGAGAAPQFYGTDAYVGVWATADAGATWTTTPGATVKGMLVQTSTDTITRLGLTGNPYKYTRMKNRATTNDWSWQFSAGTLTIRTNGVLDPNTVDTRVIAGTSTTNDQGLSISQNYFVARNLDIQFSYAEGIVINHYLGAYVAFMNTSFNLDDGFADGAIYYSTIFGNGPGLISSGSGDGVTWHGGSVCIAYRCWVYNNLRGSFDGLENATVTIDGCLGGDSTREVYMIPTAGAAGSLTYQNNICEMTNTNENHIAVEYPSGLVAGTTFAGSNNTVVNLGTKSGSAAASFLGGSSNTAKWNIIRGFGTGLIAGATHDLTEDYNDFFDVGTNTNGAGIVNGGHSFTADPLFTNYAAGDYTLQAGSPAIGTAVGSTQIQDAAGRQRPAVTVNNIGAMEYL